jgi:hypothetical protein
MSYCRYGRKRFGTERKGSPHAPRESP